MLHTPLGRLRLIGTIEGISFLVLLGIAMPMKYFFSMPFAVTLFGWLHGVFFILYLLALAQVTFVHKWSILRVLAGIIAAFLPFGPFLFDARIRRVP